MNLTTTPASWKIENIEEVVSTINSRPKKLRGQMMIDVQRDIEEIRIASVRNREGIISYALRSGGNCINLDGDPEYEPMPSSRDEEFYKRCRFTTQEQAVAALNAYLEKL